MRSVDLGAAGIAAAIAEPARARMLYWLLDGHARTSTELAMAGEVSPSTASAHLGRLAERGLVSVSARGRHRYYRLADSSVARALEALTVVAGRPPRNFVPTTPEGLRFARTCYDHMAGHLAVRLRERFEQLGWLASPGRADGDYDLTAPGSGGLAAIGVDIRAARALRRRFAYACVDWSERRPHIAGALGRAVLDAMLKHRWLVQDLSSRALTLTAAGRRQLEARWGLRPDR